MSTVLFFPPSHSRRVLGFDGVDVVITLSKTIDDCEWRSLSPSPQPELVMNVCVVPTPLPSPMFGMLKGGGGEGSKS